MGKFTNVNADYPMHMFNRCVYPMFERCLRDASLGVLRTGARTSNGSATLGPKSCQARVSAWKPVRLRRRGPKRRNKHKQMPYTQDVCLSYGHTHPTQTHTALHRDETVSRDDGTFRVQRELLLSQLRSDSEDSEGFTVESSEARFCA